MRRREDEQFLQYLEPIFTLVQLALELHALRLSLVFIVDNEILVAIVIPDDSTTERFASFAAPCHGRLTLVGYTCGDV